MSYNDANVGSVIQDFQIKNAINKLADNCSVLKDLISIGAGPATSVSLQYAVAASYSTNNNVSNAITSLAKDVLNIVSVLKQANLMR